MNTNVKNICEIVEEVKGKLTDYQYKTIMDNLMILNNGKEEVEAEVEEETDEELEELSEQISFLNIYIPTIDDDELKKYL
jgi:hydroxymethylpyrimidine/phosphomethylpyrimidine kinase